MNTIINKIRGKIGLKAECVLETDDERQVVWDALNALEKQEKHKWHDLRKNPEDLPNPEQPCPICILYYLWKDPDSGEYETDMLFADYDREEWGYYEYGWHAIEFSKVIAWKYIELFEEDEEDEEGKESKE